MRQNTTLSTMLRAAFLLALFTLAKVGFAQPCDPKWNRSKSSNCENSPIQFEANSPGRTTFEWDFGDGTSVGPGSGAAEQNPAHAYAKAGTYTVIFKGSGGAGPCTDTVMITIKESPTVKVTPIKNLAQCFKGNQFCFIDSTRAATGSSLLSIKYLFSDGALYTLNNPKGGDTICHTVIDPRGGLFDLIIEAEDKNGCITKIKYDTLIRVFPKIGVNFISSAPNACIQSTATITNLTPSYTPFSSIQSFVWNFGFPGSPNNIIQGSGSQNINPQWWMGPLNNGKLQHTYNVANMPSGTYIFNAKLTVTTIYGCVDSFTFKGSATISILNVDIIAEPDSSCSSTSLVEFTAVDRGTRKPISGVGSFLWNFGDPPSGPANFDKNTLIKAPHNYGLGPWMTSLNLRSGPCNVTVFDTITKVGPTSSIETIGTRVPIDEKYQCVIRDSVHFTNVSTFYHTDDYPVFEDSSAVVRFYTLASGRKVGYYQLPLTIDTILPYTTYTGVSTTITRFYLENDTLESFDQGALAPDSIYYFVKGVKVKKAVVNPIISGKDTLIIRKIKQYAFRWPGNQTAVPSSFPPLTQRHKDHVLRLWDFGDNYAPKCTTDTRRNKNVGLNCNFSMDSLPVHWYTPWDYLYKYYNNGQFISAPAEKTVLCKGGRFCYKIRYYPAASFVVPSDTLVIVPKDSTFTYGGVNITPSTPEKMTGSFRIKKVPSRIVGVGMYTPTLSDETWTFKTPNKVRIKNITTGVISTKTSGTYVLKKGDQFELLKGDTATLKSQVVITAGKTINAQPTVMCIDTIIGGRDTFIQRSRTFIDSAFHRQNFYKQTAQCNTVKLYHEDTVHALRCKSLNQISLALVPPNAKGLEFKGIRCYAPPSPPYGMEFSVGKTKPGCTQRLLKFNFDSASGKNNWVTHGGFLSPPLPGSSPWWISYPLSGAYPTSFVKPYGAGEIRDKNPGWVTVGVIIGNGRYLDKTAPVDSIECIDTVWYHNAFRYLYLDSRFDVIVPEVDKKRVCVGDTITFRLIDPMMDSITSLVWNWNDDEGSYYEERFFYYKPYKGPSPTRNDKNIAWKSTDKWLYHYVVRLEYNGFSYKTLDTIVTGIMRKWSIGVDVSRAGDALKRAFEALGLDMNEIPPADIPLFFGNGTGKGCIDTTGLGSLISYGIAPYRDALTFTRYHDVLVKGKNGKDSIYGQRTTWRYTDFTKKDSVIIDQVIHWRHSSMQGWDTLKQAKPNRYSGLTVTPGVYKHVYKKANRYFPTFQLRNTEGCFGPRNKEVDVGFYWNWTFSDSIICHGNTEITLHDSIRYFAYEDPFIWLDPKAYWMDPNRFVKLREWKKIDFNEHDDSLKANQFNTTGIGIPPFKWHYDDPGIYNIRIAMKDSLGCMDTARQRVYVTGVKAGFKVLNGSGLSCKNIISFKDTSVVIDPCVADKGKPCDNIVEYTWDFGDGKRQSKLKDPSHDYTQNGSFTIKLKVKTKLGCEDSTSFVITINGPRPYFNPISDTIVCAGDSVIFDNQSYDPLFSPQWEWNFGDGKVFSDNVKRPVGHRYTTPGTYKVYLTQFDNINGTAIRCSAIYPDTSADQIVKIERIVKVKPVAPASFDIAPNDTVCPNDLVSYTSNSDTIYKRFMWRFGDGDTINTNTPSASHSYKKPGTYTTTMIPDYDTPEFHKCLDTTKKSIVVVDVFANFTIDDKDAPKFCFTNTSVGGTKYSWKFEDPRGDGSSTDVDPCYTWQDTGCYDVTLTVTNDIGCTDDTTQQVCYKFVSKIIPYNVFTPEPKDGFNDVFRVNAEGLDQFDIVIYNRWGEVVFESKDQFFTWNGKVKNTGADCPEGTYFYIMNYKIRNKPVNDGLKGPVSGTVTLIRGNK